MIYIILSLETIITNHRISNIMDLEKSTTDHIIEETPEIVAEFDVSGMDVGKTEFIDQAQLYGKDKWNAVEQPLVGIAKEAIEALVLHINKTVNESGRYECMDDTDAIKKKDNRPVYYSIGYDSFRDSLGLQIDVTPKGKKKVDTSSITASTPIAPVTEKKKTCKPGAGQGGKNKYKEAKSNDTPVQKISAKAEAIIELHIADEINKILFDTDTGIMSANTRLNTIDTKIEPRKIFQSYLTSGIIEIRGISLMLIAIYYTGIANGKFSKLTYQQKSDSQHLLVGLFRFINCCKKISEGVADMDLWKKGKKGIIADLSVLFIKDMEIIANRLQKAINFVINTIPMENPELAYWSSYDFAVPNLAISPRQHQIDAFNFVLEYGCPSDDKPSVGGIGRYNASIGSGKTTACGGICYLAMKEHEINPLQLVFFTSPITAVREEIGCICHHLMIPFALATLTADGKPKISPHYLCKENHNKPIVVIGKPDVIQKILEDDTFATTTMGYTDLDALRDNCWLLYDEPTVGADRIDKSEAMALCRTNVQILLKLARLSLLVSATMPELDRLPAMIDIHEIRYGDDGSYNDVSLSVNEVYVGCNIRTNNGKLVMAHDKTTNAKDLSICRQIIDKTPFIGRTLSMEFALQLISEMRKMKIDGLPDEIEFFSDVNNLKADATRQFCMSLLEILNQQSDQIIKSVCSKSYETTFVPLQTKDDIDDDDNDIFGVSHSKSHKSSVVATANSDIFATETLATISAHLFPKQTLIASASPVETAMKIGKTILDSIVSLDKRGVSRNVALDDYLDELISSRDIAIREHERTISNLEKSMDAKKGSSVRTDADTGSTHDTGRSVKGTSRYDREKELDDIRGKKPKLKFPSKMCINSASHREKYCPESGAPLRENILSYDDIINFKVSTDLTILLMAGIGIYDPSSSSLNSAYLDYVRSQAKLGNLAYIIANEGLAYGTNMPIEYIIIDPEFGRSRSINTIFQMMGRGGRFGITWQCNVFIDSDLANKIIAFTHGDTSSSDIEATNIVAIFDAINREKIALMDARQKELEKEKEAEIARQHKLKAIEEATRAFIASAQNKSEFSWTDTDDDSGSLYARHLETGPHFDSAFDSTKEPDKEVITIAESVKKIDITPERISATDDSTWTRVEKRNDKQIYTHTKTTRKISSDTFNWRESSATLSFEEPLPRETKHRETVTSKTKYDDIKPPSGWGRSKFESHKRDKEPFMRDISSREPFIRNTSTHDEQNKQTFGRWKRDDTTESIKSKVTRDSATEKKSWMR